MSIADLVLVVLVELDHAKAATAQHHVSWTEHRAAVHFLAAVHALIEELKSTIDRYRHLMIRCGKAGQNQFRPDMLNFG